LKPIIARANLAFNFKRGTLRGMHFQFPPAAETKLVRATRGAILDIIVDLRPESPTRLGLELPLPVAVISDKDQKFGLRRILNQK
jgi:dTDP-4-dehydrorhamnose 3,5-epimerase-like enzyme